MAEGTDPNRYDFDEACCFIMQVGKATHNYGSSGSRIEQFLAHLAAALGFNGIFDVTPTRIQYAFRKDSDSWQQIALEDVPTGGWNLNRLAALGEVTAAVEAGRISITEAMTRLDAVDKMPNPWGNFLVGASFLIAGAGFAPTTSGSDWDVIVGGILGLITFFIIGLIGHLGALRAGGLSIHPQCIMPGSRRRRQFNPLKRYQARSTSSAPASTRTRLSRRGCSRRMFPWDVALND